MKSVWGIAALLALAGCGEMPQRWTEAEIHDMASDAADDVVQRQASRISDLEAQVEELERKIGDLENEGYATKAQTQSVADLVARNADIANNNAVREMTMRGACGLERENLPGGGYTFRNKKCTLDDLSK